MLYFILRVSWDTSDDIAPAATKCSGTSVGPGLLTEVVDKVMLVWEDGQGPTEFANAEFANKTKLYQMLFGKQKHS